MKVAREIHTFVSFTHSTKHMYPYTVPPSEPDSCPDLSDCLIICSFGRDVDENGCEICQCSPIPELGGQRYACTSIHNDDITPLTNLPNRKVCFGCMGHNWTVDYLVLSI